jgi:hypothetical protein
MSVAAVLCSMAPTVGPDEGIALALAPVVGPPTGGAALADGDGLEFEQAAATTATRRRTLDRATTGRRFGRFGMAPRREHRPNGSRDHRGVARRHRGELPAVLRIRAPRRIVRCSS